MTYRELLKRLREMQVHRPERLDDTVTVYDSHSDEYLPAAGFFAADDSQSVLDVGHFVISLWQARFDLG